MRSLTKKEIEITLILSKEEALYLKNLTQNYIGDRSIETPDFEPLEHQLIRETFFNELKKHI